VLAPSGHSTIIVVQGSVILDGRNRLAACHQSKVRPHFVEYPGETSVVDFILLRGLHRRSLNEDQRVTNSLAAYSWEEEQIA
jgi:hypothetical protein